MRCLLPPILGLIVLGLVLPVLAQPPAVPRSTVNPLDAASYVELARQWREHIDRHGESAQALVNLGLAYDYGEEHEAALIAARRAVELAPDDPHALEFLGKMLLGYGDDVEGALRALERCREVAPEYGLGLTTLAVSYQRRGEFQKAVDTMRVVFDRRIIPRPLQDYAYNMLIGLPPDAVLITAGDNDTFPPLALQAGMGLRTDVLVLNRSLLNDPSYATAVFEHHPTLAPDVDIRAHEREVADGTPKRLSTALIHALIREGRRPIYLSASVLGHEGGFEGELEGINLSVGGRRMATEDAAKLFLERYRLDSATDWDFPWKLRPSVPMLLRNYVAAILRLLHDAEVPEPYRSRLLEKAREIAEFHDMARLLGTIHAMQSR